MVFLGVRAFPGVLQSSAAVTTNSVALAQGDMRFWNEVVSVAGVRLIEWSKPRGGSRFEVDFWGVELELIMAIPVLTLGVVMVVSFLWLLSDWWRTSKKLNG